MRSSKSRSRSKQNRPRTLGNIINRVFDSSGPEGKVRGTPQQIIEKYQLLARDAQLSNDRVAAENFLQHAEHYTRLLAEANREMAAEQEARQSYQQNQGGNGNGNRPTGEREFRGERDSEDQPYSGNTAAFDVIGEDDAGLVELPEFARPQQRRDFGQDRPRNDRGNDNRSNENRGNDNRQPDSRQADSRPNDQRSNDSRPREDRNTGERNRNDRPRSQPGSDRPREDRRPDQPRPDQPREPRAEQPREPRAEQPREPRVPRFEEAPVAAVIATVPVPTPTSVVAADAPAPAPAEKPAPKPRVRKPAVKPLDAASE